MIEDSEPLINDLETELEYLKEKERNYDYLAVKMK